MNPSSMTDLMPFWILASAIVVTLIAIAFGRHHKLTATLTFAGLATAFGTLIAGWQEPAQSVARLISLDGYARIYLGLILLAALAVSLLSYGYLEKQTQRREEYYILLMLATLGAVVLAASDHFVSFFLGLELLSVSLYALLAYRRNCGPSIEAGLKYLVLAGVSSAFLLFGMALVYAQLGTMEFGSISAKLGSAAPGIFLFIAFGMILVGIGFKLALVPFHLWTPDVYQGAPAPVTAFLATVSKGAMFALLIRFFAGVNFPAQHGPLMFIFVVIAIASMMAGNLLALLQNNVKRILAYSSIAHLGYLLVAFLAGKALGIEAVTFYLAAYFATTLVAFGVIAMLSNEESEFETLEDYRGLAWRRPWLAGVFTAALLSLAGIPLTAGFWGKFYLLLSGADAGLWLLLVTLVVTSVIGLFYYLRVLSIMYQKQPNTSDRVATATTPSNVVGSLTLGILAAGIVWLGVYPMPVMGLLQNVMGH